MEKMRLVVLVDLPECDRHERKIKRAFEKWLFGNGYTLLQPGVYARVANGRKSAECLERSIRSNAPELGMVRLLILTEAQFQRGSLIAGCEDAQEVEIGSQLDVFL